MVRKHKMIWLACAVLLMASAVYLVLYALKNSIDLYYTPTQYSELSVKPLQQVRLGGMVMEGSIKYSAHDMRKFFTITDFEHNIQIEYAGIFPDLFKEKQGVVVRGKMNEHNVFVASEVLAKHDENYMPPLIKDKKRA